MADRNKLKASQVKLAQVSEKQELGKAETWGQLTYLLKFEAAVRNCIWSLWKSTYHVT